MRTNPETIKIVCILILLCNSVYCGNIRLASDSQLVLSDSTSTAIDEIVSTLYENGQYSGAVLVSVKGEILYEKGFGYADIAEKGLNTPDTKFRIASFTKAFTAMLILQLIDEGVLEFDGKLTDYIPEFPEEKGKDITILQLLTHRAGITGESRISNLIDIEKEYYTRERLLSCIAERELVYKPGRGREYSNFGYALLGLVIEKVTGKTYDEVLHEKICKPAGMTNTLSDITAEPIENRAIGYTCDYFTGLEEASFLDMSFCLGSGQLLSTVKDLYLFDQALYTDKLLNKNSNFLFFTRYGWRFQQYPYGKNSKRILSNVLDGSINGFQSHTHRVPQDSIFIVVLRNVKESVYENQIAVKWASAMVSPILAILYDEPYDLPKKSAAFTLFKELLEDRYAEAQTLYANIKNGQTDSYYLDDDEFTFFEKELNTAGMIERAAQYKMIYTGKEN